MSEEKWLKSIVVYTDGACSGNPGPGGWASVVAFPEGHAIELGGGAPQVTNNQMELMAVIQALNHIQDHSAPVVIFTDSTYVIRGITQWIWGWKKRGWKNAEGEDVQNKDLWERLHRLVLKWPKDLITWQYIRGHTGNPGNERCDEISVRFSKGQWVDLYKGPLVGYSVAVYDFPEDVPLPEMRPKQEKQKAHSYLSILGGTPMRHQTWAACEKRVKGQSGAKFKKAMSASDESEILQSWGVSTAKLISDKD